MGNDVRNDAEAMERRLASRELGKARRSIAAIRNFYIANIILCVSIFVGLYAADAAGLALGAAGGATLLMVVGFVQIRKQPYFWSFLIACVWSLVVIVLAANRIFGYPTYLAGAWTVGCWTMLPSTKRAHELMAAYPDLWSARQMKL